MKSDPSDSPIVRIAESAAHYLRCRARAAHPDETGGILLGVAVAGNPWITRAVELTSDERGQHHYRLPAGMTRTAVRAGRRDDPRLGYLGEWHSHPADVGPSAVDRRTMKRLARRTRFEPSPVLLVVRRAKDDYLLDLHQVVFPDLHRRQVLLTGDLSPPDAFDQEHSGRQPHHVKSAEPDTGRSTRRRNDGR